MANQTTFRIARGASCRAAKWKPIDVTWPEFLDKLNSPARTGETVAEYKRMSKADKSAAKDVGGFVAGELAHGKRSNRTVRNRSMVTLDADKAYPGQWDDVTLIADYCMAMYSTHSHTPAPEHPAPAGRCPFLRSGHKPRGLRFLLRASSSGV